MVFHPLKKLAAVFGLSVLLVSGAACSAHAFTETKVTPPVGQPAPGVESPALQIGKSEEGGLSLSAPDSDASGGTELKIPGVGSIGTVPKLDFGLELLYGSGQGTETPVDEQKDDVLIKGKIRHRF